MISCRRVIVMLGLVPAAFVLTGALAFADDRLRPAYTRLNDGPIQRVQAKPDCTCRAKGSDFVVGQEICLNSATFRCVMDQNVTSWRQTKDSCPTT